MVYYGVDGYCNRCWNHYRVLSCGVLSMYHFYMPSSGRANKLITLNQMPHWVKENLTIIVSEDEYDDYAKAIYGSGIAIKTMPEGILLAEKDQWMFTQWDHEFVIRIEDDLTFFVRDPETKKLSKATIPQVSAMFEECLHTLIDQEYPMVGISSRGGNNFQTEDFVVGTRMHHIWFINTNVYKDIGINLVPFKEFVMDDFHTILCFLRNGYPNKVFFKYACDDRGSNAPGGASQYRTSEVQRKSALWLAEQHDGFVRITEKSTTSGWEGMDKNSRGQNVRTDVTINWKKAYTSGQNKLQRKKGFAFFNRSK